MRIAERKNHIYCVNGNQVYVFDSPESWQDVVTIIDVAMRYVHDTEHQFNLTAFDALMGRVYEVCRGKWTP